MIVGSVDTARMLVKLLLTKKKLMLQSIKQENLVLAVIIYVFILKKVMAFKHGVVFMIVS